MSDTLTTHPPDICLLLRVDAEQRWLVSKVIPLLRQLEQPGEIPSEEAGPALAYLEVQWLEAGLRAAETDAAAAKVEPAGAPSVSALTEKAHRYHAAVRRLRQAVDRRVRLLTSPAPEVAAQEPTGS
ncbi:MAG TPA: hypothetical protein VH061_04220 [Solirubrobacteraceae bacterium]|jgi:hypothetical protein|nr:hypothetical protein [Solirubrobacteraceae bacterium]